MIRSFRYIAVLTALIIFDITFNLIKRKKSDELKCSAVIWGIIAKVIELMLIIILYMLDWLFSIDYLKYMGVYYFGICEIISILENYTEINQNLPKELVDVIKKLQFSISDFIVKKIKKTISEVSSDSEYKNGDVK